MSDIRPSRRNLLKAGGATVALSAMGVAGAGPAAAANPAADPKSTTGEPTFSETPFGQPTASIPDPGVNITAVRGGRTSGYVAQTRSEVLARNGVVATSQSVAAQAGVRVLAEGGNSADAAVATAAMLGLVETGSASIGGDSFALHYSAADRKVHGLYSAGWSPAAWTPEYFSSRGYNAETGMPNDGIDSATVPGAVAGWEQLLHRFGRKGFDTVLQPSVELAEEGFGVTERIRDQWSGAAKKLSRDQDSASAFLVDGKAPGLYDIFRNPDLARAYRAMQRRGADAFYRGEIAEAIVAKSAKLGGAITAADLAEYQAEWVEPLSVDYHGYEMHQLPPTTQGFAVLIMLNVIKQITPVHGYDLAQLGPRSPLFWHLIIEAKKLAYDDLNRYNGDPHLVDIPMDMLLSDEHGIELCRQIDPQQAHPPQVPGAVNSGTVYITTADRWGNMTSFIYSNFSSFGSGVTIPGYGFPLQNRGALFNLDPTSPNSVAPRKRPFHTLIPAFVTNKGRPVLSYGNMGGSEQAQAQALEMVFMINLGMNPQAATDAARFHHDHFNDELELEPELHDLVGAQLAAMGHHLSEPSSDGMGGYQAIHFTPEKPGDWPAATGPGGPVNGLYRAASDHRKDGSAIGW
ncbi:gamma-glutamyltransferase [Saccharopolyspora sp. 5N708]|uniref:gamma-glutamyltransferase n=1 Tax=Saccharopolyspora sp. 5N708 TaxID=3457424 RepID=UPI003FD4C5C4